MIKDFTPEEQHLQDLELLKKLRPIDDDFMRELFRDNIPLIQLVLRIITGIDDLIIVSVETQYDLEHLLGARSICLDVLATDSNGHKYNLEIQRSDKGASPMRARYHSSAMDVEFLKKNQDFEQLPVTYVILITENDTRKSGKPINIYSRRDEDGNILDDKEYIVYVNGAYDNPDDDSDLAKLIHDFTCCDHNDMHFELIAERTEYYKETPKGVSHMCKLMEDMVNERAEKAAERAAEKSKIEIAVQFLALGTVSREDIAKATGLSIEQINELAAKATPVFA